MPAKLIDPAVSNHEQLLAASVAYASAKSLVIMVAYALLDSKPPAEIAADPMLANLQEMRKLAEANGERFKTLLQQQG